MAKEKTYKCPQCNKSVPASESEKIGNRYFHLKCAEKYYQQKAMEEKELEEKRGIEQERRELLEYIAKLQKVDFPDGLVLRVVKNLHEEGYSYRGIKATLVYFYEIQGNPIREDNNVLGIVPYVYSKAKAHWIKVINAWKKNDEILQSNIPPITERKVRIKVQERNGSIDKKIIDIENL